MSKGHILNIDNYVLLLLDNGEMTIFYLSKTAICNLLTFYKYKKLHGNQTF